VSKRALEIVSIDMFGRHKVLGSIKDCLLVFGLSFSRPVVVQGPLKADRPLTSTEWILGVSLGAIGAAVVVWRYRRTSVSVHDDLVVVVNPWRTCRLRPDDFPLLMSRINGFARCVRLVDGKFHRHVSLIALPLREQQRLVAIIGARTTV
jgi:hypothetical protein